MKNKLIIFLFNIFIVSNLCGQVRIRILNNEIDDLSSVTLLLEDSSIVKNISFKRFEKNGIEFYYDLPCKIKLSLLGYYDTLLYINNRDSYCEFYLKQRIEELEPVFIKNLKQLKVVEEKNSKGSNLLFDLVSKQTIYFTINLEDYSPVKIISLDFKLENVQRDETLEVKLFNSISDIFIDNYLTKDSIELKNVKNNQLSIIRNNAFSFPYKNNFIVSIRQINKTNLNSKKKTSLVTKFTSNENQIYIQNNKSEIEKIPMSHYLKYFKGYPNVVKTIVYEK